MGRFHGADLPKSCACDRQIYNGVCLTALTFQDIVDAAIALTDSYAIYVTAGLVLGTGMWALKRLVKSGR